MRVRIIVAGALFGLLSVCPAFAIRTVPIATGLLRPNGLTAPPGDAHRVFILEQHAGRIRIVLDGQLLARPFLDLNGLVATGSEEQGLLGLAFHPNFAANGYFYVNYSRVGDGATMIVRYGVSSDPDSADPLTAFTVLTIAQPFSNHNGGDLVFGRDGYLYIGMGDGGSEQDPLNSGQDTTVLLGKMLRIDVDHGSPYSIPADNPFATSNTVRHEIWATGLRNPWRYSFDRATGDLYIGDVGQDLWEEIDFQPASSRGGENYGWRLMEGNHCFNPPVNCDPGGLTNPIWEYSHASSGCAVVGDCVYRGNAIPSEVGNYFFGDYCTHRIWSFRYQGGGLTGFQERTAEIGGGLHLISSFGEDAQGELYICDLSGGQVVKIVPDSTQSPVPGRPDGPASGYRLYPNEPNPFNATTRVSFDIPRNGRVSLTIYDLLGDPVAHPVNSSLSAGHYTITFDGQRLPSGLYFCELQAEGFRQVEKMVAIK